MAIGTRLAITDVKNQAVKKKKASTLMHRKLFSGHGIHIKKKIDQSNSIECYNVDWSISSLSPKYDLT